MSAPCCAAGKAEAYKKTVVYPRADQLTSTYTSAQLAYRYGFPILQEKSNRRALATHNRCQKWCRAALPHHPPSHPQNITPACSRSRNPLSVQREMHSLALRTSV